MTSSLLTLKRSIGRSKTSTRNGVEESRYCRACFDHQIMCVHERAEESSNLERLSLVGLMQVVQKWKAIQQTKGTPRDKESSKRTLIFQSPARGICPI